MPSNDSFTKLFSHSGRTPKLELNPFSVPVSQSVSQSTEEARRAELCISYTSLFVNCCCHFLWYLALARWRSECTWSLGSEFWQFLSHFLEGSELTAHSSHGHSVRLHPQCRHHDPGGLQLQHWAQPGHGPLLHARPHLRGHQLPQGKHGDL